MPFLVLSFFEEFPFLFGGAFIEAITVMCPTLLLIWGFPFLLGRAFIEASSATPPTGTRTGFPYFS